MTQREPTQPWQTLEWLLPPKTPTLEGLCRHVQTDPAMVGLLVEGLIHAPLSLLVDTACMPPGEGWLRDISIQQLMPLHLGHPDPQYGLLEPGYAVFTDVRHFYAMEGRVSGLTSRCLTTLTGLRPLQVLVGGLHPLAPIAVDPLTRHGVVLQHDDLLECLNAWHATEGNWACFPDNTRFVPAPQACQVLRERMVAFLSQFEAIQRAYVVTLPTTPHPMLVLGLTCTDEVTILRVRRALPLLSWQLAAQYTLRIVLNLSLQSELASHVEQLSTPIYDAAAGR